MKTLTVKLEPAIAEAVEKLASLQGISEQEYIVAAVKLQVDMHIDLRVRDLLGVELSDLDPDGAEVPTDSEGDSQKER